jgi:hypothetical protein
VLLLGRNDSHLQTNAADLVTPRASVKIIDLTRLPDYGAVAAELIMSEGVPDQPLIAYGTLEQEVRAIGDICWDRTRPLTLLVMGSVADDRGRNLVYGSAKRGLDLLWKICSGPMRGRRHIWWESSRSADDCHLVTDGRYGQHRTGWPSTSSLRRTRHSRRRLHTLVLVADRDDHSPLPRSVTDRLKIGRESG